MLTRVEIRRFHGDVLSDEILPLYYTDPLRTDRTHIIRSIDGLGPVNASISTMAMALNDGHVFLSATRGTRNIVINVDFLPDYKNGLLIPQLREQLYSVAPPKSHVTLALIFDDRDPVYTNGWVEVNEPSLFNKETSSQLSIICIETNFVKTTVSLDWTNTRGHLAVPYREITPVGFTLRGTVTRDVDFLTLKKEKQTQSMTLKNLKSGDTFLISTISGKKEIRLERNGISGDALSLLSDKTYWMQLDRDESDYLYFQNGGDALTNVRLDYIPEVIGVA